MLKDTPAGAIQVAAPHAPIRVGSEPPPVARAGLGCGQGAGPPPLAGPGLLRAARRPAEPVQLLARRGLVPGVLRVAGRVEVLGEPVGPHLLRRTRFRAARPPTP
jgi:hypothetical protein